MSDLEITLTPSQYLSIAAGLYLLAGLYFARLAYRLNPYSMTPGEALFAVPFWPFALPVLIGAVYKWIITAGNERKHSQPEQPPVPQDGIVAEEPLKAWREAHQ